MEPFTMLSYYYADILGQIGLKSPRLPPLTYEINFFYIYIFIPKIEKRKLKSNYSFMQIILAFGFLEAKSATRVRITKNC